MSADNPNGSEGDDKPVPAAPVPANESESVDPRAETRSRAELEDSAHSRSLPSWDNPPAAASQDTGSQDAPATSSSANDGEGDSQPGQGGPGQDQGSGENSASAESGSRNGGSAAPETAGAQQDTGTAPGAVTVPGDAQDGGLTPAPEAVDPGYQGENVPADGEGANVPTTELSRGELEDKAFSRPLPSWDDDASAAAGGQDGAGGPDTRDPVAGTDARQRTERDGQQQSAAPTREREPGEAEAQKSQNQQAENEKPDEANPPAPQQQHAYNEASHPEADGQGPADAALAAAQREEIPVTRPENSPSEVSKEQNTSSAERPEDPAASTITPETVAQEPGPAEDDPDAQPQGQLSAAPAESGTGSDDEPEENTEPQAEPVQASTTEHHPQTSDPEPEPDPESEIASGQNPDSPNQISMELRMQALERREAGREEREAAGEAERMALQAEMERLKTRLDASEARADKLESQHEEDQVELEELKAKLEPAPSPETDGGKDPDEVKAGHSSDQPKEGTAAQDNVKDGPGSSSGQDALLDGRRDQTQKVDENLEKPPRWRRIVTSDHLSVTGTLIGAANTAAEFGMHATPEGVVSVGLMVLSLGALALGKFEKRRKDKK